MKKYCLLIVIMMKLCCIINKNVTIQNTGVLLAPEKLYLRFQEYVILNGNKTMKEAVNKVIKKLKDNGTYDEYIKDASKYTAVE